MVSYWSGVDEVGWGGVYSAAKPQLLSYDIISSLQITENVTDKSLYGRNDEHNLDCNINPRITKGGYHSLDFISYEIETKFQRLLQCFRGQAIQWN